MNRNVKLFGKKSFVSCLLSLLLVVIVGSTPTTAMAESGSKKITSSDDIDKVLDAIRTKLLAELKENDEVDLY